MNPPREPSSEPQRLTRVDRGRGHEPSTTPPSSVAQDVVGWLVDEAAATFSAVPGFTWTAERGVTVAAACGPTDAHEGWWVIGVVVAPGERVPPGFGGGEVFTLVRADGLRRWTHVAEPDLWLVERDDGRVEFERFVAVEDAPEWEVIDQIDVEVVFGPERCG
jgi:hypothetical protein